MPVIDSSKIPSAAEIISQHVSRKETEIKKSRFQADRYNRPPIFDMGGIKYAAPTDNNPPPYSDFEWIEVGTVRNRKVYATH